MFDIFELFTWILQTYLYISICLLPFVFYYSLFEGKYRGNGKYYHKKEWYYFAKVLWAKPVVDRYKNCFKNAIRNESKESIEKPRLFTNFLGNDTQLIFGSDQRGNSIYLRLTLRENRLSEICLQIRLQSGKILQLPDHPLVLLCSIAERRWKAGGLEIEVLEPFSCLRITYNGFIRDTLRNNEFEDSGDVIHCSFDFMWRASTEAKFFPQEISSLELSKAVAMEPWRNSKWIKLLGQQTGYDQYGCLSGEIICPIFPSPIKLNLLSNRKRCWGPNEIRTLHRALILFAVDAQGTAFNIMVKSNALGCKELFIGSMMMPNRKIVFIEDCNISLPDFVEEGVIPGALSFSFKAQGKVYKCSSFAHKTTIADMRNEEQNGYNNKVARINYMINGNEASGLAVFWYKYKGKGIKLPPLIIRPGKYILDCETKFVVSLKSPECRSESLAGTKGTNLALLEAMKSNEFKLLDGFCVLIPAFKYHLIENMEIQTELMNLKEICCGNINGNLEENCEKVQELFIKTPLGPLLKEQILRQVRSLKIDTFQTNESDFRYCWTVRTSIKSLETTLKQQIYLDCFTDEDVLRAILSCWASVYSYSQVKFRRACGMPILMETAVIIQYTLLSNISGYITTCDPVTGDVTAMVITANHGLGVSLLDKEINADKIKLKRSWNGSLSIELVTSGEKSHMFLIEKTGLKKIENKMRENYVLSNQDVMQLGKVAILIEKALGQPKIIHWGLYKDSLYILSIKSLKSSWFNFDFTHENDTAIVDNKQTLFAHSPNNIFPDFCSTLTLSTSVKYLEQSLQELYKNFQGKNCTVFKHLLIQENFVKNNIFEDILKNVDQNITEELKILALITTGNKILTEELNKQAIFRNQVTSWKNAIFNLFQGFKYCYNSSQYVEEAKILSKAIKTVSKTDSSTAEQFQIIERNLHLLKKIIYLYTSVNFSHTFRQNLFLNLMHDDRKEPSVEEVVNLLDIFSSENALEPIKLINKIIDKLNSKECFEEFLCLENKEAVFWLEKNCPEINDFMERFGHKSVNEFDLISDPWSDNILSLMTILQKIGQIMDEKQKHDNNKIRKRYNLNGRFLKWLENQMKNSFSRQEQILESLSFTINKFRLAYRKLASKLYHDGKLPNPALIFHLKHVEIKKLIQNHEPNLILKAIKRSKIYENHFAANKNEFSESGKIFGTTVVPEKTLGRVCVVDNIRNAGKIEPDDILVVKNLDTGWTPFFCLISGIICEKGSLISPGAILARKINLPCVINVKNITNILKTGDIVLLTGKENEEDEKIIKN